MLRPDTPLNVTRAVTTQNFASSTIMSAAPFAIFALTTTFEWSFESSTFVTVPMLTSLYLMVVLPASRPSAALKTMVMVGPSLMMRWTAIPTATTAARIGMIQTMEIRARLWGTTVACGIPEGSRESAMVSLPDVGGVPDESGVESLGRDHRQHDDRREE